MSAAPQKPAVCWADSLLGGVARLVVDGQAPLGGEPARLTLATDQACVQK